MVGEEADPDELKYTTTDKKNLIEADREDSPSVVGEKIIEKIRGNCTYKSKQTNEHEINDASTLLGFVTVWIFDFRWSRCEVNCYLI